MKKGIDQENEEWEKLKNRELYKYIKKNSMYSRPRALYWLTIIGIIVIGVYHTDPIVSFFKNLPNVVVSHFDTFLISWAIAALFLLYVFLLSGLKWRLMLALIGLPIFVMSLAYVLFPSVGLWPFLIFSVVYHAVENPFIWCIEKHFLGRTIELTQPIKIRNGAYSLIQDNHFGYIYIEGSWWAAIGSNLDFPVGTKLTITKVEEGILVIEKALATDNHSS